MRDLVIMSAADRGLKKLKYEDDWQKIKILEATLMELPQSLVLGLLLTQIINIKILSINNKKIKRMSQDSGWYLNFFFTIPAKIDTYTLLTT